jgi:nucleoside-diphosphate-sugar epimerase
MKRILITGAGGFIGRNLVNQLSVDNNNLVYALDDNSRGSLDKIIKKKNIIKKNIDVTNFKKLEILIKNTNFDICYHLAAINGTKNFYNNPEKVLEVGVAGTLNIVNLIKKYKIKKFFFFSSSEAYQKPNKIPTDETEQLKIPDVFNPRLSYGGSKIIGELITINYLTKSNTRYYIIRPHNVYGPDMGDDHVLPELATKIKNKLKLDKINIKIFGSGKETRSFIYIDDAVRALILISKKGKPNQIYNLGNNDEKTIIDIIMAMSKILKKKISVTRGSLHRGSVSRRCPDVKKLQKLNFKSKFTLVQGIEKTLNFYVNR